MLRIVGIIALVAVGWVVFGLYKRTKQLNAQAKRQTEQADKSKVIDLDHDEWAEEERAEQREKDSW